MTYKNIKTGISHLHNNLIRMGVLVERQLDLSIRALLESNMEFAETVKREDQPIDDLQREIEDEAIKLIATQQPVASDLRIIFTTIKIVTDLERMGDHAVDIARIAINLRENPVTLLNDDLVAMKDTVTTMIQEALDAFVCMDEAKAYEVTKLDDIVDDYYVTGIRKLYDLAQNDPSLLKQAAQLNFVTKYMERMGDHVTNICEWTIYIVTGEFVQLNL
ncbi:MAG TPA: phosphate signaling complex protein PhoU [Clostridiaceae bacterium]|nr:phosphate signaling complex protein PhoU [Clostridiaceae bacterium]